MTKPAPLRHRIADIRYVRPGSSLPAWCACTCGWSTETPSDVDLEAAWVAHRAAVKAPPPLPISHAHDEAGFDWRKQAAASR